MWGCSNHIPVMLFPKEQNRDPVTHLFVSQGITRKAIFGNLLSESNAASKRATI